MWRSWLEKILARRQAADALPCAVDSPPVIPAKAGLQGNRTSPALGPRLRGDDGHDDAHAKYAFSLTNALK